MKNHVTCAAKGWRSGCGVWIVLVLVLASVHALAQSTRANGFEGTWSGVFTTQDHPYWQLEDHFCFAGCPPEGYAYATALIDDPANDARPVGALQGAAFAFMRAQLTGKLTTQGLALQNEVTDANDPTLLCQPYGFARLATNPLPLVIRREGANLVIDYEEWSLSRTIYLDGRGHPRDLTPTALGHSIGRIDGDTLVVDTAGLAADIFFSFLTGGGYSDQARGTERYTIAENPRRLNLELTIEDPVMLREPHTIAKTWLFTPDVELVQDSCEDLPAQPDFEGVGL
jgi:hypothetical protein